MKRLTALLMGLLLALSLASCSDGNSSDTSVPTDSADANEENVLIAYFSKTGNTEEIANEIQSLTGGYLFKIETVAPYPEDYTETTEVAQQELNDSARPEISRTVENMEQYEVIYLGYPIWWGNAPMAVYTFLESYDLSGKTIVPFCTSGGTQIEESIPMLEEACAKAKLLEGFTANDPDDVKPWLEELGLLAE